MLSGGISEALVTTMFGLMAAVEWRDGTLYGLQFDEPPGGKQPGAQFVRVDGFGEVLIRAALQASNEVLGSPAACEQNQVRRFRRPYLPGGTAISRVITLNRIYCRQDICHRIESKQPLS